MNEVELFEVDSVGKLRPRTSTPDNRYLWSWATGVRIQSYASRLREKIEKEGHELAVANVARVGATSRDFLNQARALQNLFYNGRYDALGYVTILASVNDVIDVAEDGSNFPSYDEISANYREILRTLASVDQKAPLRVALLPLVKLADLGVEKTRNARILPFLTCDRFRAMPFHRAFYYWSCWNSDAEYQRRLDQIREFNRAINRAARSVSDEFPGRVEIAFLESVAGLEVTAERVAIDGAHPSFRAHQALAKESWESSPWSR